MKFKKLIDNIFFLLSVPKCVSCGERLLKEERSLCAKCLNDYRDTLRADCSMCGNILSKCTCSNRELKKHFVHKTIKLFRYISREGSAGNMLIYNLKHSYREDVCEFLADELYDAFENSEIKLDGFVITNVPRRRHSISKYGYDHSAVLAKALAKKLGIKYVSLLKSKAKSDQKEKRGREERFKNADFDYKRHTKDISGKNVILLDDIITTGASMCACSTLLHGLGAKKIISAAVAIAYKDDYTPFKFTYN